MQRWEYCVATLGWRGVLGARPYQGHITYYKGNSVATEDIETRQNLGRYNAIHAIGEIIGKLGAEGWELVSYQHETERLGFTDVAEAVLKRPI